MSRAIQHKIAVILFFTLSVAVFTGSFLQGISIYRVISGSMEPAMPIGSLILVQRRQNTLLEPGQVITFSQEGLTITHRITEIGFDGSFYYLTKGDANQNTDINPVYHREVLGRVVFILPPLQTSLQRTLRRLAPAILLTGLLLLLRFSAVSFRKYRPARR